MNNGWPLAPATTSTRHNGAPTMTADKEKGTTPFESAPQTNDTADSTAPETPRALFHPLTWRPEKPARFRGKAKRRSRAAAIARKRGEWGSARADLLAWLATLAVFALAGWLAGGVQ